MICLALGSSNEPTWSLPCEAAAVSWVRQVITSKQTLGLRTAGIMGDGNQRKEGGQHRLELL